MPPLDVNGRTDTKTEAVNLSYVKSANGVRCPNCLKYKTLLFVSRFTGRLYCSESCMVKTEVGEK